MDHEAPSGTRPPYRWAPGWYSDPWAAGRLRWWDGGSWTRQSAKPVTRWMRRAAGAGSVTVVACLCTSVTLSALSLAWAPADPCGAAPDALLGPAFLLGFVALLLVVPVLWCALRVVRLVRGARNVAPRAAAIVVMIVGLPAAAFWWLLASLSHACLF